MRTLVVLASVALAGCTITLHEDPKVLASLDRIGTGIEALRVAAVPAPAQQKLPQHVVCKPNEKGERVLWPVEQVGKDEKDLGPLAPCPPPNEVAACIGGEPQSNIAARCAAGKI